MHIDPTIHLGDLISVAAFILMAYQRISSVLRSIEAFMEESRLDRIALHKRLETLEHRFRSDRHASAAAKLAEERMSK